MSLITEWHPKRHGYQKRDPRMVRLRNPRTGRYLHLSGVGETNGTLLAWLGYRHQADKLRLRSINSRTPWPYQVEVRE